MFVNEVKKLLLFMLQFLETNLLRKARHDYSNVFVKSRKDIAKFMKCSTTDLSVLVLGCGYHYPEVIMFSNVCKHAVGLDTIGSFYRDGLIKTFRALRGKQKIGVAKALAKAVLRKCWYYIYFLRLRQLCRMPIQHARYKLFSYDGIEMPFEDESFDVVLSNAVLEHVINIDGLFQEVSRVTKKGGLSYHVWHNYYSFSGGHVSERLCRKHPWGHLRGKYETSGLNRLTPHEIWDCFSKYFGMLALFQVDKNNEKKGISKSFQFEAIEWLSENVRNELEAFPIELLLTRAFLILGRKP